MATLSVEIVTGERLVFSEQDVDMVVAPGADGTLGILPRHAPLITTLAPGELRIKKGGGEETIIVYGGFMEVTPEKVIVLADSAERPEEIDVARAEAARQQAESSIANRQETADLESAAAALRRANLRLKIGRRRVASRPPTMGGGATG